MCGLAGIYNTGGGKRPFRAELSSMLSMIAHRGPDGHGYHIDGDIGLAHARLSIVDLESGAQPIHNEDKSVWVVLNGEIFNYIELRQELEKDGHQFYTQSDTEVIVHLYEHYGEAFVHHLNGQYAIALWDNRQKKLLLVRDRVGIQPLFYCEKNGRLFFASEVKAILAVLEELPVLDASSLDQLMTFWSPVAPNTMFRNIFQVLPGEMIVVSSDSLNKMIYWDWEFPEDGQYTQGTSESLAEELHELLRDATRLRLRADVPVGAYLSGGLDSSVLTTLMHEIGHPLRTFSIGFEDESLDESDYQSLMIKHLGMDHSRVHCHYSDIAEQFKQTIWHTESPILRTAPVPMKLLSRLVREQGYKVVLTGEGADEVLGGYDIFKETKIRAFWAKQPDSTLRPLLLKRLYPYLDVSPGRAQAYVEAFFGAGLDEPNLAYFSHIPRWNTTANCKTFFSEELKAHLADEAIETISRSFPKSLGKWHGFNKAQYIESKSLMAGYLLCSQGDRMLMANSVEGRFPFLDHRVIEFANKLPPKFKMKGLNEKYLLKKAMRAYLPKKITQRYKQPYRAPDIPSFFQHGRTPEYVEELLSEAVIKRYGYFDGKRVSLLIRKIRAGRSIGYKENMAFIGILSTQIWHDIFIEQNVPSAA